MATPSDELRAARSELRQSKRSLRDVREKLNNIIDDDTDETTAIIKHLEDEETSLQDRIRELEARIAELETSIDSERSELARQEGQSRVILPAISSEGKQEDKEALTGGFISAAAEDDDDDNKTKKVNEHEHESISDIPSTSTTTRISQLTAADLGALSVPTLQSPSCIGAHLSLLEQLFHEAGAGVFAADNSFLPHGHLRISVYNKLLESLKPCTQVAEVVNEIAQNANYQWSTIKSELQQEFARRDILKAEYNAVIRSICFSGLGSVETFLRKALAAFRMYRSVYGNDRSELRTMVRSLVMKLPEKLRVDVVRSLQNHNTGNKDWELSVPFDDANNRLSVISVIRANCRTFRDAGISLDTPQGQSSTNRHQSYSKERHAQSDRISQVSDGKSTKTESLSKWAGRFGAVFVVTGPGVVGSPENHVQYDDARHYPRRDGNGVIWFLAYKDEANGTQVVNDLSSDQFETRRSDAEARETPQHHQGLSTKVSQSVSPQPREDSVFALSSSAIPPEIVLSGALRSLASTSWDSPVNVPILVDSGAGGNYLLVCNTDTDSLLRDSGALFTPSKGISPVQSVSLADGSRRTISKSVDVTVGVYPVSCNDPGSIVGQRTVTFSVLPVSPCPFIRPGSWCVLAGRCLLALWDLATKGSSIAIIDGTCVFRSDTDTEDTAAISHRECLAICHDYDSPDLSSTGVEVQPTCDTISGPIQIIPPDSIVNRVEELLDRFCAQGWRPLVRCPSEDLRIMLRRLLPDELRDTPSQKYCFTVDLSAFDKSKTDRCRSYARGMYNRLQAADKDAYTALIDDYIARQWWTPVDDAHLKTITDLSPPIPVFMIGGSSKSSSTVKKHRLVLDCRSINKGLPSSSSENPTGHLILNSIRWTSPVAVSSVDAQQAFYRLRVYGLTLLLMSALGSYISRRICFGLSPGTSSLQSSLGALFFLVTCLYRAGFWSLYVDDGILAGAVQALIYNLTILIYCMLLCGFAVQPTKFACTCEPSRTEELRQALVPFGVEPSDSLSLLRTTIGYSPGTLVLRCCRETRLDRVYKFACSDTSHQISKASAFSYAGALAYDVARVHPECRCCSDGFRSLIGRCLAQQGWNTVVNLCSCLSPLQLAAYDFFIKWMQQLSTPSIADCSHATACPSDEALPNLTLVTDASRSGGGFLVLRGSVEGGSETDLAGLPMLCGDGFRWNKTQRNYHSNRRELLALVVGLRACADLVNHYFDNSKESSTGTPCRRPKVCVLSDNKAVIHWSREDAPALFNSGQALEKRALTRLVLVAMDELKALKRHADVEVRHVKGCRNVRADELSRLFDNVIAPGISLSDILCDDLPDSKPIWPEETDDDIRFLFTSESDDTSEADCYDPYARDRLLLFRHCEPDSGDVSLDLRTDYVRVLATDPPQTSPCLVERIARGCYDYSTVLDRIRGMRFVIGLLRNNASGVDLRNVEYAAINGDADKKALVHSAQLHDDFCNTTRSAPQSCGPYVLSRDDTSDMPLVLFRSGNPFGNKVFQYVLPKTVPRLREKVLKDAHSQTEHQTVRPTLAAVVDYHMPGGTRQCRDLLSTCIICRTLRAERSWSSLPSVRSDAAALAHSPPYWHVAVDFLAVGDYVKLFSAVCMFTRHITLFRARSETSAEAVRLLRLLKVKTGAVRIVTCDRAAYFRSSEGFLRRVETEIGAEVRLASSRAPWEICSESHHAIILDRLRCMLRHSSGKWPSDRDEEEFLLERLMSIINARPLGNFLISQGSAEIVTPDSLYFGRTRDGGSCLIGTEPTSTSHQHLMPNRLKVFRNVFLDFVWSELRKRSLSAIASKCRGKQTAVVGFYPGDAVLVSMAGRKCGMSFRMGHVVKVLSPRRVRVRFPGGLLTHENAYNLVVLRPFPRLDPDIPTVSREGQRLRISGADGRWREGLVTFDPCDPSNDKLWIQFDNGDAPEFLSLSMQEWESVEKGNYEAKDRARESSHGGRDETEDSLIDERMPSRVGMRISVATALSTGTRRPRRKWCSGKVCAVRKSGALDILWDDNGETARYETVCIDDADYRVLW